MIEIILHWIMLSKMQRRKKRRFYETAISQFWFNGILEFTKDDFQKLNNRISIKPEISLN